MDFFQSQQQAKRNTSRLVGLFGLAIISLIVMTNLLVMLLFGFLAIEDGSLPSTDVVAQQFDWETFFFIGISVTLVILLGSIYKTMSLSAGGKTIAESLGGTLLTHNVTELNERKLLNVVEEMAIASGTPVPSVYLMKNEHGINAFAAGFKNSDAVIGVTQGCIDTLDREELQGVVAHEFSHILNGDMRLNMRLLGILHGILVIGYIGYFLLRSAGGSRKNAMPILGLGFSLVVIGFGGNFFGNMIKASVSRQREYLADASAVQFTRNKDGIASALNKIAKHSYGSTLDTPQAPQMSHAYFSNGVSSFVDSMFATHPPIEKRIKRVSPYFLIKNKMANQQAKKTTNTETNDATTKSASKAEKVASGVTAAVIVNEIMTEVGKVNVENISHAQHLIAQIPTDVYQACHCPFKARALIYCLLLNKEQAVLTKQLKRIKDKGDHEVIDHVLSLREQVVNLEIRLRLPLIDLVLPTLKQLSIGRYQLFKSNLDYLINADEKVDTFEWVLQKILLRHLDTEYNKNNNKYIKPTQMKNNISSINVLFAMLINFCHANLSTEQSQKILMIASDVLNLGKELNISGISYDYLILDNALNVLSTLAPADKEKLLRASLYIITSNKLFSSKEMELMRAIADTLDCPMPPQLSLS
ncbi:M48 family metallopeptidase [Thalassomonas sp. M1454]|uniref:M48 family metallopeptidase n=1 Tax=Thalassomonas sp. M1454 TaxID=2594477 RepID=UPI00117F5EA7|nr:M48 family metallopeptidase [Thalassomonas sp. M1454]TRX53175.1 M48 family metallopeptidase [Thalassomonas sp. M1454]